MSEHNAQPQNPLTLQALAESTAQTFAIHSDMMMSIDLKLDRISEKVDNLADTHAATDARLDRLAAIVENTATTVTELSATVRMLAGAVAKQEARVDKIEQR